MSRRAGAIRGWIAAIAVVGGGGNDRGQRRRSGADPQAVAIKSPELRTG